MILPVRSMDDDGQHQAKRIDGQMSFTSGDFLAGVVASFVAANFGRLHALTIDNHRSRGRLFACLLSQAFAQFVVERLPNAFLSPTPKNIVRRLPFGKIMGQGPPLTTGSIDVQDGVDHPATLQRFASAFFSLRQQVVDILPLSIREIAGILRHRYGSVFLGRELLLTVES